WQNMFQTPTVEILKSEFNKVREKQVIWATKHQLTHRTIYIKFVAENELNFDFGQYEFYSKQSLIQMPFPTLYSNFLKEFSYEID
ncbi:MAG: hypothetical protein KDC92_15380, partial [Bacteroidetes bacterium]|nr:hypothetical protein [Bacteroidota bacterium]